MLVVRDLVKRFPTGDGEVVRAIDGVSLTVSGGELVALYGPSGSGKTTLLKIIAAVLEPDRGEVALRGRSVLGLRERDATLYRLRDLGLVLQTFHLVAGLSAGENAALKLIADGVPRPEARRRVEPLLRQLGLDTRLEHRTGDLSMGERQRLALAKALSNDPPLVLADEPTGSLDTVRGRAVLRMLRNHGRARSAITVIATHDPKAARFADTVYTLRDGRLVIGR